LINGLTTASSSQASYTCQQNPVINGVWTWPPDLPTCLPPF